MNGQFVISLDFEKFWGVFDSLAITGKKYDENLNNVDIVIDRLLELSNKYSIKLTFATVGFLFNKNKNEFLKNIPSYLPTYTNVLHNPYPLINYIGNNEIEDTQRYAYKSLQKIKKDGKHEIGTHTYCHYYCLEDGQSLNQFEADLLMAKKVAKNLSIDIKSIVFPRNQVKNDYLKICQKHGILSYRGFENHSIYHPKPKKNSKNPYHRALRLSDAYLNLTGNHTYKLNGLKTDLIVNIPSSIFFRPFNSKLSFLETFKIKRVQNTMTKAAKKKELFHMWFHPHNFGNHMDNNFKNLEKIFKTFSELNKQYNFESETMTGLALKLKNN